MEASAYAAVLAAYVRWASEEPDVLGLAAVGSTASTARDPDPWSDHDLLVMVRPGRGPAVRSDLAALPGWADVVLAHQETEHAFTLIDSRGHLVELAIFEPDQLAGVVLEEVAILLDKADVARVVAGQRAVTSLSAPDAVSAAAGAWAGLVRELVIGVGRARRGELLSAHERISGAAVRHVLLLAQAASSTYPSPIACLADPYRRAEQVVPEAAQQVLAATRLELVACAGALLELGHGQAVRAGVEGTDAAANAVRTLLSSPSAGR